MTPAIPFLPTTAQEIKQLGWKQPDIILVTGDAYIDSPLIGVAVIGRVLQAAGFKVAIIGQPDYRSGQDIKRLGEPALFWGVTGGCLDSLVANRTASNKQRKKDDYTPGGENNRRPDRAVIVYSNLIRAHFKATKPIVLGGIEASLRRIAHYDFWRNQIKRSILFDAKADYLLYGMAEQSVVILAEQLRDQQDLTKIRGLCYIAKTPPTDFLLLPDYATVAQDKQAFYEMFQQFYRHTDPVTARPLAQRQDSRYLLQNPPAPYLETQALDAIHQLPYQLDPHPFYQRQGKIKALETIRFSLTTHQGCYGECNFCAIAVHQGRQVRSRSQASIVAEAQRFQQHPAFKGVIHDVGGPTANMYGFECQKKSKKGSCPEKRCLYPRPCTALPINHQRQIKLLRALRQLPGIRHVFVASGIRHDMILADKKQGEAYLRELISHHVSGQLKLAPEHSQPCVLAAMGKPGPDDLPIFRQLFLRLNKQLGKKQFLTYYLIAAHPGCQQEDMQQLRSYALKNLQLLPEQVQVFTPTPSTLSSLSYWTERHPQTGKTCYVEKKEAAKERQKRTLAAPIRKKKRGTSL